MNSYLTHLLSSSFLHSRSAFIFAIIGLVSLLVLFVIFKASNLLWYDDDEKKRCLHICSDFRLLLNCLCSCLKRKNKNSEVFLFWKPLSQGGLSAEGARDTREGRRGRDNVKLCHRTELHILS